MFMNDYPDVHTHRDMEADGFRIINCSPDAFAPCPGHWYSVGVHPWSLRDDVPQEVWERLQAAVAHPQVLAIGEAGLDKLTNASMALQETVFIRQAKMADAAGKPLIVHLVKATDALLRLKKELKPRVPWIIHGFRGKAQLAEELLRHDFYLSFGAKFQAEAVRTVPLSSLFIETDESLAPITETYGRVAAVRQIPLEELCKAIRANVQSVFFH